MHLKRPIMAVEERHAKKKNVLGTHAEARADIFDYIEVFYNRTRRHNHLGGLSPEAFERASF
jgi:putative transposase